MAAARTEKTIDLDKLFRKDSGARRIAERLLTGEPVTRQDLSREANLSVTSVNRVIATLERAGAKIERDIAEDGRQARFHLKSIGKPRVKKPYPNLQDRARIVRGEIMGDALMVDVVVDDARFRGALAELGTGPSLIGRYVTVTGVNLEASGTASIILEDDDRRYTMTGVHAVG